METEFQRWDIFNI